jgi:hypothetical protein
MKVELDSIAVMSVKAIGGTKGAKAAFDLLESKLPGLKGRKFYGTYNPLTQEYRACVQKKEGDDSTSLGLEDWTIPGGAFLSRKVNDWPSKVQALPRLFYELGSGQEVDSSRPSVEFYRSERELVIYIPVQ